MKTIQIKKAQPPCKCVAYAFPHRAGSGQCTDPGPAPKSCDQCAYMGLERDPYGTGDRWYSTGVCEAPKGCPWGVE